MTAQEQVVETEIGPAEPDRGHYELRCKNCGWSGAANESVGVAWAPSACPLCGHKNAHGTTWCTSAHVPSGPKPPSQQDLIYRYLEELRRSGVVNMFGAGLLLEEEFHLDHRTARAWLANWMQTYKGRTRPVGS